MERIKLIWDFRGPMAEGTAKHHIIHLEEFANRENIPCHGYGVDELTEYHHAAFMIVNEEDMIKVRDALRPHRAEIVQ